MIKHFISFYFSLFSFILYSFYTPPVLNVFYSADFYILIVIFSYLFPIIKFIKSCYNCNAKIIFQGLHKQASELSSRLEKCWMVPYSTVVIVAAIFKNRFLKIAAARKNQISLLKLKL